MLIVRSRPDEALTLPVAALGTFLVLHGVAHFAGLVDAFDQASAGKQLDYLGGAWTISDPATLRTMGVLWAAAGSLMVLAAVAVLLRHSSARRVVAVAALLSLMLSVLGLWAAVIGVGINLALLAVFVLAPQRVGLQEPS